MFKIVATMNGNPYELDEAETKEQAEEMATEYRQSPGFEYIIEVEEEDQKMGWKTIKDEDVTNVWICDTEGCEGQGDEFGNGEEHISPDWYADNGTPTCRFCERDMSYVRTMILDEED